MTIAIGMLIVGLVFLVFSADFLVKGASRLATSIGISPLVVGLTVVAFGTSAPELAVSVMSAFKGQADIALGNVVGSNIFNILVILGISALIIPLVVHRQLVRFDVPIMIALSFLTLGLGWDGTIGRIDGIILFAIALAYTGFLIRQSRRETNSEPQKEALSELGDAKHTGSLTKNILFVVGGVIGLIIGSKFLVDGAVVIARAFQVSELVIGLTIISAGTSLPEVAASIVAAVRGERDIAVGNVVGSCIFNLVCVLGLSSIVAPIGISVPQQALHFDLPVMIAASLVCLPIFFTGYKVTRLNGGLFMVYYGLYLAYLFLISTGNDALDTYRQALLYGALPLTLLLMGVVLTQVIKHKRVA